VACAQQSVSLWWEPLKIVGTAAMSAIASGYLVSRWKSREDAIEKRLDELWSEIKAAGEQASEYWRMPQISPDLNIRATAIQSTIARIDGTRSTLAEFMSPRANEEIAAHAATFLRQATGGNFGVHNREAEESRAAAAQLAAANYAVWSRRARMRDLKGWFRRR
jgi:hypothetical protein